MNDQKTQIVEKLKSSNNILVTVSANPSVDQLAACVALTVLLNKYKKTATAVFSGKVPTFLNYLKPSELIEKNTDSLRDFIISLDKSKADKLRYKVEDDVVKIFITPYRTGITPRDLKYSAGDFNIDLILALGVHHQQDLDKAITAHGRIFHDAVTMSINNYPNGDLGVANWEDIEASSLSELIADLIESLDPNLLDGEIATALLTGIVAETGRFSNEKTHPRTMTVSSRLLQAGADQQLVNTQLQDLIGVVVTPAAGAEIKPTKDTSHEPLHHNDVAEELLVTEDGQLQPTEAESKDTGKTSKDEASAPKPTEHSADKPKGNKPEASGSFDLDLPGLTKNGSEVDPIESILGTKIESTPAPVLDQPTGGQKNDAPQAGDVEADADEARQAIEDALGSLPKSDNNPQPAGREPAASAPSFDYEPTPIHGPIGFPTTEAAAPTAPAEPAIQGIAANQPSYSNPNTTTQYDMPVLPAQEAAPLVNSPADQPFTMPLPPNSSMPGSGHPQSFLPSQPAGQQSGGTPPPPLPPPMPPNFG